eukprot:jgi/Undpi1/12437/HiC_scaffold_5.g02108.m1
MASRKHWVLRGRILPNIGDSAADIQSFVGEDVNVTTSVATQLRAISDFDVRAYGPRAEGMVEYLLMVADRLDFLRQALVAVLSGGFSLDSDGDRHCRERVATIDAAFTTASADLRRHTQAKPSNRQYYPALWLRGAGCHEQDGKRRSSSPTANSCIRLPWPTPLHLMLFATAAVRRRRLVGRGRCCAQSPAMVHVDTTSSDGSFAESGCVGGCACGGVRLALPEDWRRNALVGRGCNTGGVAAGLEGRDEGRRERRNEGRSEERDEGREKGTKKGRATRFRRFHSEMSLGTVLSFLLVGVCWGCTTPFLRDGTSRKVDSEQGCADGDAKKTLLGKILGPLQALFSTKAAVPFIINQSGSGIYYLLLGSQDLSMAVPICSALNFVFASVTAMCLGEKVERPVRNCAGMLLVLVGIAVCAASKATAAA